MMMIAVVVVVVMTMTMIMLKIYHALLIHCKLSHHVKITKYSQSKIFTFLDRKSQALFDVTLYFSLSLFKRKLTVNCGAISRIFKLVQLSPKSTLINSFDV